MKNITSLILAFAMALSLVSCASTPNADMNDQADTTTFLSGKFASKVYHEDGDYYTMNVIAEDGGVYSIDYYVNTLYDSCVLELDDGEIVSITSTHIPDNGLEWLEELDEEADAYYEAENPETAEDGFWAGYEFAYEGVNAYYYDGESGFEWADGLDEAAGNYMNLCELENSLDGFWTGYNYGVCAVSAHYEK